MTVSARNLVPGDRITHRAGIPVDVGVVTVEHREHLVYVNFGLPGATVALPLELFRVVAR